MSEKLKEALDYLQFDDWYYHVEEGISLTEKNKLGESISEVCETLREILEKQEAQKWQEKKHWPMLSQKKLD